MSNSDKQISKEIIAFVVLLVLIVVTAFVHSGWIGGLHILSAIINIVGYLIVAFVNLLGAVLPYMIDTIIQNVITTVIIWVVCILFCTTRKEKKAASIIVATIVSAIFTFISWANLING